MTIQYDTDMFSIISGEVQSNSRDGNGTTRIALFRDPKAVEALLSADQVVRQYLITSGVGLSVYESGAPAGRYPAGDHDDRMEIAQRLADNLDKFDVEEANWGGFDLAEFLTALVEAEPMDEIEMIEQQLFSLKRAEKSEAKKRRTVATALSMGMGLVAVLAVGLVAVG